MTDQDRQRIEGCDGVLIAKVERVHTAMAALGFPMMVGPHGGKRTTTEQQALYAPGHTIPGLKVTNADGVVNKSNHQTGRAIDSVFMDANGNPSWDSRYPWAAYIACGEAVGLRSGAHIQGLHDLPHMELPPEAGVPV